MSASFATRLLFFHVSAGHMVTTLNFPGLPGEIVLLFSFFVIVVIVGWTLAQLHSTVFNLQETLVLAGFGVVFVIYVFATLFRARPHFKQNLTGVFPELNHIAKKYFVIPSAVSIGVMLYDLACADLAWNARVSVNHDVEYPSHEYCHLVNLGASLAYTGLVFTHCADAGSNVSQENFAAQNATFNGDSYTLYASSKLECEQEAALRQTEYFAWNDNNKTCQAFNFCNEWAFEDEFDGAQWTGFVRCVRVVEKYWTTIMSYEFSQGFVLCAVHILVAMTAIGMRRIYLLDPYSMMSQAGMSKHFEMHSQASLRHFMGCLRKLDAWTMRLVFVALLMVSWVLVLQPSFSTVPGTPLVLYQPKFSGWFMRAIGQDNIFSNFQPANIAAYVLNAVCCLILGFGAPLAAIVTRCAQKAVLRSRMQSNFNSPAEELKRSSSHAVVYGHDDTDAEVELPEMGITRPGLRRVQSSAPQMDIEEAVRHFKCISDMPQISEFVSALSLFDRTFRRGGFSGDEAFNLGLVRLCGNSIDALVSQIKAASSTYNDRDCELIQQRLREPHKAVYCMAMIGVVQEAQFPKFAVLAQRLAEETETTSAMMLQQDSFDAGLIHRTGLTDASLRDNTESTKLLMRLYAHAQRDKLLYDYLVNAIAQKTDAMVQIATLKSISRTCEKIVFKGLNPVRNVNRVFDVVRGYLVFSNMTNMLMALNHLIACSTNLPEDIKNELGDAKVALAKDLPRIELVRVKNRLLHPTEGGWSDVMLNLRVQRPSSFQAGRPIDFQKLQQTLKHGSDFVPETEPYSTVCELQLINASMFTVRHKMAGHQNYVKYRTAKEVLAIRQLESTRQPQPQEAVPEEWVRMHEKRIAQEGVDLVQLDETVSRLSARIKHDASQENANGDVAHE